MIRVICLLMGYCFGLFQTAYFYGRAHGIDIRQYGSGNSGTTNALRVLGTKAGLLVFAGDCLKCMAAVWLVRLIFGGEHPDIIYLLCLYTGAGAILGHNYPFYMGFKGGKGIAASSGVVISMFFWPIIVIDLMTFIVVTAVSKFVSLGSICLMSVHFILVVVFDLTSGRTGWFKVSSAGFPFEFILLTFLFTALAIFKHRGNIVRLMNGTERRIGEKKREEK